MYIFNHFAMNKSDIIMNKITDSKYLVRLECCCEVLLKPCWERAVLTGHHWRLYLNDGPGAGVYYQGRKVEMAADTIYLLAPDCNLRVWCDNPEVRQLYLHFEVDRLGGKPERPIHPLPLDPVLAGLADELRNLVKSAHPLRELAATALAATALLRLDPASLIEREISKDIDKICEYMRQSPGREVSVGDLAAHLHMPVNRFIRLFESQLDCTPYQFLTKLRYARAQRLLEAGELSIDAICEDVGIRDRFHFSRTFKRLYGLPPALYRRNHQQGLTGIVGD